MRKLLLVFVVIIHFCYYLAAQTSTPAPPAGKNLSWTDPAENVVLPPPTAFEFQKYTSVPVSQYTGIPSASIPLYQVSAGTLSVPISLSYYGGGVKVDDISSWIGTGWSLNVGGVITRTLVGEGDETSGTPVITMPADIFHLTSAESDFIYYTVNQISDFTQRDVFTFNCGPYEGKFLIVNGQVILQSEQDLKFDYTLTPVGGSTGYQYISEFQITDPTGIVYNFGFPEFSSVDGANNGHLQTRNSFKYPSSWHLYSIVNPATADYIYFEYQANNYVYNQSFYRSLTIPYNTAFQGDFGKPCQPCANYISSTVNSAASDISKNIAYTVHGQTLTKITTPTQIIQFNSITGRPDYVSGSERLGEIKIYNSENILKRSIAFVQNFWTSNRMYLDKIVEKDATGAEIDSYKFTYNNGNGLPPRLSPAQDYQGYYNGMSNSQSHIPAIPIEYSTVTNGTTYYPKFTIPSNDASKEFSEQYMQYGTLTKIQYPTGGFSEFTYEPNTVPYEASVHEPYSKTVSVCSSASSAPYGCSASTSTSYITIDQTQNITVSCDFIRVIRNAGPTVQFYKYNGTAFTLVQSLPTSPYTQGLDPALPQSQACPALAYSCSKTETITLTPGLYKVVAARSTTCTGNIATLTDKCDATSTGSTINPPSLHGELARAGFSVISYRNTYYKNKMTGGLRIKKIAFKDGISSNEILTKHYVYSDALVDEVYTKTNQELAGSNIFSDTYVQSEPDLSQLDPFEWDNAYIQFYNSPLVVPASVTNKLKSSGVRTGREITNLDYLRTTSQKEICTVENELGSFPATFCDQNLSCVLQGRELVSCTGIELKSVSKYPLVGSAGKPVVYKKVYEISETSTIKDITESTFTYVADQNPAGIQSCAGTFRINEGMPTDFSELCGKLKTSIQYKIKNGAPYPVLNTTNYYSLDPNEAIYPTNVNYSLTAVKTVEPYCYTLQNGTTNNLLGTSFYYTKHYSFFDPLRKSVVINYDDNGNTSNEQTTYNYDNPNHHQVTSVVQQKADVETKQYTRYPLDIFPNVSATTTSAEALGVKGLIENYRIGTALENYTEKKYFNGSTLIRGPEITASSYTKFTDYANPKPAEFYQLGINAPLPSSSFTPANFSSNQINKDSHYQSKLSTVYYGNGNLISKQKTNDINICYIWDYGSKFPIAEVTNADTNSIAYTSFEADGKGRWSFTGTPLVDFNPATGNKSYNLASGPVSKGLSNSKSYIVTFWSRSGTQTVSNSSLKVTGTLVNGWTYFRYLTNPGITSISVGGSGVIDELRLYPVGSEMTTYTYDPLAGITSQCSKNNDITYYEYDDIQRLKLIRNQNHHVLKKYCYNYAGQPVGCSLPTVNVTMRCTNAAGAASVTAQYTNVSTAAVTSYTLPTTTSTQQLSPTLASGVYNLKITSPTSHTFQSGCNSMASDGTVVNFYNITVSADNCNTIIIPNLP